MSAEQIADDIIARSLEFPDVRSMLIAAASATGELRADSEGCNGLCITASEIGVGGDQIAFGHPDCSRHGHLGRLEALLYELAAAQRKLEATRDAAEESPGSANAGPSADLASYDRDGVLTRIVAQMLRGGLHLSPGVSEADVAHGLVMRARRDAEAAGVTPVTAGVFTVLNALGIQTNRTSA